jgi:hypothetical protein
MIRAVMEALGVVASVGIGAALGWSLSQRRQRGPRPSFLIRLDNTDKVLLVDDEALLRIRERFNEQFSTDSIQHKLQERLYHRSYGSGDWRGGQP